MVSLARLLPEIAADTDEQHSSNYSRGHTKLEPEIQTHTGADGLCW